MIACSIIQGGNEPLDIELPSVPREGDFVSFSRFHISKVKSIRWMFYEGEPPRVEVILMNEREWKEYTTVK